MRVAIILPSLKNKGPIVMTKNLIMSLQDKVTFEVFYFDEGEELDLNCKCNKISFYNKLDFAEFDLVHSHMLRPDLYCAFHKKNIKPPVISTLHQYIESSISYSHNKLISFFISNLWKLAIKRFEKIVCINPHMSDFYTKAFKSKVTFIYNGVQQVKIGDVNSQDAATIQSIKKENYIVVITIVRLMYEKGIDQVIKALSLNPKLFYIVIGEGVELNNIIELAAKLNVSNRLLLMGYKPNATSYLQFADVYIHPSRSEGFGLALVEAASCKLPLVCSSITTFKYMFTVQEAVFFELEHIASIENAIMQAYQNKVILGDNAYHKFLAKYSLTELGSKYLQVYSEVKQNNKSKYD